jgi:cytochrome d ubiquinol oxidase subunit I
MVLGTIFGLYFMWKKKLDHAKWTLRFLVVSVAFPQIANQVGWMTAEIGRQPWIVWKLLRTTHGVSPGIQASHVLASLVMLSVIYCGLLAVFLFLLDRKIKHGPDEPPEEISIFQKGSEI